MTDDDAKVQADEFLCQGDDAFYQCRNGDALRAYSSAWGLYSTINSRMGQARVLRRLGDLEYRLAHYDSARCAYAGALLQYKELDDRLGQAKVLLGLGDIESTLGRDALARKHYSDAAAVYGLEGSSQEQEDATELAALLEPPPPGLVDRLRAQFNERGQMDVITCLSIMAGTLLLIAGISAAFFGLGY